MAQATYGENRKRKEPVSGALTHLEVEIREKDTITETERSCQLGRRRGERVISGESHFRGTQKGKSFQND